MRGQVLVFAGLLATIASGQNILTPPPASYQPITGYQRLQWAVSDSIGIPSLVVGTFSAGWGTLIDQPPEYGTHWLGFAKRYGMRLTGVATEGAMEASLGLITGEDPRYMRQPEEPFNKRVKHIVKMTFMARNDDGDVVPAYARYMGMVGSSFLSNTWRADSEANTSHAITRIGLGFLGRMGRNAVIEFWPDVKGHVWLFGQ